MLPTSLSRCMPDRVAFWSGSGISLEPPTQGPLGETLTRRALDLAFGPGLMDLVVQAYSDVDPALPGELKYLSPDKRLPRLETVLDVAAREHGLTVVPGLLADLASPPPNEQHRFFAGHLGLGGSHATANFDRCIEAASGRGIVHFHG